MKKSLLIVVLSGLIIIGNAQESKKKSSKKAETMKETVMKTDDDISKNPLIAEWNTPFQTPPFDKIKNEDYLPAFAYAMKEAQTDIDYILKTKSQPTFKNTIVALDQAGALLNRISSVFFNMLYCNSSPQLQEISKIISPKLTEHANSIMLNEELFKRVEFVWENDRDAINGEDYMLLEKTYLSFVNNGAKLSEGEKKEYRNITVALAGLSLDFSQNVLAATNSYTKLITDKKELSGIPAGDVAIAAEKAKKSGQKGWLFDLSYPSYSSIMKYADNRELRREMYLHYASKAMEGENSNIENILQIIQLRDELAHLLKYSNYASYVLQDRMAENTENVYKLLDNLSEASIPAAKKEIEDLFAFAQKTGFQKPLQRWDYSYYAEKQKKAVYDISDEELKPYFKLENVISGVFHLASTMYDLKFVENKTIPVYHPDVKVYEVYRKNKFTAILYLDFHPRESKKEGAWMTSFREQHYDKKGNDIKPLVSLVMNFTPSTPKNPSLLTLSEVTTFLHEFGHALHGMLSNVRYESLSGTNVPRDFVELPSQIMENYATEQAFLNTFAFHYKTKATIPEELIARIKKSENYMAGYASCRQLSFGYLDMMWHTCSPDEVSNVIEQEKKTLHNLELLPDVPKTCMSTSFSHIFAGGYAAGYYGYKWAEVLDADAFSLFKDKGILNPDIAEMFYNTILSKGGSEKAEDMFIKFRGRKPQIDALLIRSGLK